MATSSGPTTPPLRSPSERGGEDLNADLANVDHAGEDRERDAVVVWWDPVVMLSQTSSDVSLNISINSINIKPHLKIRPDLIMKNQ